MVCGLGGSVVSEDFEIWRGRVLFLTGIFPTCSSRADWIICETTFCAFASTGSALRCRSTSNADKLPYSMHRRINSCSLWNFSFRSKMSSASFDAKSLDSCRTSRNGWFWNLSCTSFDSCLSDNSWMLSPMGRGGLGLASSGPKRFDLSGSDIDNIEQLCLLRRCCE